MTELLTAAQIRAIEQAAIESGEVTGLELMERAGLGVVEAIFEEWPELAEVVDGGQGAGPSRTPEYLEKDEEPHRALVLCGPGNNGGDGFVVARLLKERGWEVEVFLYGDAEKLPPDAKMNYERWLKVGTVRNWDDQKVRSTYEGDDVSQFLVIDALFGVGVNREMPSDTLQMWYGFMPSAQYQYAHEPKGDRFVAIDLPSGICSDTGKNFGALPAHLTVTFHKPKHGHVEGEGPKFCGKVIVKDIGL